MKKAAFYVIAFGLTLAVALALSEVLLRANGHAPWAKKTKDANEPTLHEPHPVYGWQNRAGEHVVPAYEAGGGDIRFTFLPGGLRRTGTGAPPDSGAIVLVGGSYTQGWAVGDTETWAWRLQERFPDRPVLNWGTAGWGTFQALLRLERELPGLEEPRVVVYGFVDHHETRNVAPAVWLRSLSAFSRRGHVDVPYVTLDAAGDLVRHPPERWLALPFREHLATAAFAERVIMERRTRGRADGARAATEELLRSLDRVTRDHGAILVVALLRLRPDARHHWTPFLEAQGIPAVDCVVPLSPDLRVPGEGHPNGRAHALWAERLVPALAVLLDGNDEGAGDRASDPSPNGS